MQLDPSLLPEAAELLDVKILITFKGGYEFNMPITINVSSCTVKSLAYDKSVLRLVYNIGDP